MISYKELKSADYINQLIEYVENILGVAFRRTGDGKYTAYCPFHKDSNDSFRVYVNDKGIVRFHCFGACDADWDVYDIIQKAHNCSFGEAQQVLATYLDEKAEYYKKAPESALSVTRVEPHIEAEQEESSFSVVAPDYADEGYVSAIKKSSKFYHEILARGGESVEPIYGYLKKRGISEEHIRAYQIGYSPSFKEEPSGGKALLKELLPQFDESYLVFREFYNAGMFRLLEDETAKAYPYYRQFVDNSMGIYGSYGDFFAGKITFPIKNIEGQHVGIMGRRPDNRSSYRWMKQRLDGAEINPKSWLYGIDKAHPYIAKYKTVILVEGIFDYFAVLNSFQDPTRPIIISTLGKNLSNEALALLQGLGVRHFVVAYDCDDAGMKGIEAIAKEIGSSKVRYLGGMKKGQDPADYLDGLNVGIDGFSMAHLLQGAEKAQALTEKPVHVEVLATANHGGGQMRISPAGAVSNKDSAVLQEKPKEYSYDADHLLSMLSYGHGNKSGLEAQINTLIEHIESKPMVSETERVFTLPYNFVEERRYHDLGTALILWLKIAIEQQYKKRRVVMTDAALGEALKTSRVTVSKYKAMLKDAGYLNMELQGKQQKLSVKYFVS